MAWLLDLLRQLLWMIWRWLGALVGKEPLQAPLLEKVEEKEPEPPKLSPQELQRLLGNLPDEDFEPEEPGPAAPTGPLSHIPEDQEVDVSIAGPEFLERLEKCSNEADAIKEIQKASRAAINYHDACRSVLLVLAVEGYTEACKQLLRRNDFCNISAKNMVGSNALHLAAGNGHQELCQVLLRQAWFARPEAINTQNTQGMTPLDFSVEFGEGEVAGLLREHGGQPSGNQVRRQRYEGDGNELPSGELRARKVAGQDGPHKDLAGGGKHGGMDVLD